MNKALFRVKSLRVFPVRSLAYTFFAAVILFFGLTVVDRASGHERHIHEDVVGFMMTFEKMNTGLDYPLVAVKGTEQRPGNGERARILVVGDSFVWGHGLTNLNQIWWSIMSSELERRGYDCDVYATGFPGATTNDEFRWLRDSALLKDIEPDLIIIGYVTNDHGEDMLYAFFDPIWMDISHHVARMRVTPGRPNKQFPRLQQILTTKIARKDLDYIISDTPVDAHRLDYYDNAVVQPFGEFIQAAGISAAVIATPETPQKGFERMYHALLPLFENAGFPVYNPLDDFIKQYPNPNYKYISASVVDRHPGPATSWFLGEYAADVLEQNYASILGEKRTEAKEYPIEINDWMPFMLDPRAIEEGIFISQYTFEYPDQSSEADFDNHVHGNFLTLPLRQKYVKLNFKYPVDLSSVKIEGEALLSAQVWTLGINHKLGFDDQKPVKWTGRSRRDVTSLLISAKTIDGKQATLTITIEGEVVF